MQNKHNKSDKPDSNERNGQVDNPECKQPDSTEHYKQPDDPERNSLHKLGTGFEFLGVLALAAWLGYKADKYFDSTPTLMIFFFISAFVTMIYLMLKGTFGWRK